VRAPKYPLELVLELRRRKVDDAARALAVTTRQREDAERRRLATQQTCEAHGSASHQVRCVEQEALVCGSLTVADLSRAEAWELRVGEESRALAGELSKALADEADARVRERRAQEELASRQAGSKLLTDHRARWRDGYQKRLEANVEEASSDAWRSRPGKPKP
jgi:hypothetical protein